MEPVETFILEVCPVPLVDDEYIENDVSKADICKLCLSLAELQFLESIKFSKNYNNFEFLENELKFELPEEVCIDCWQKLKDILLFIQKCKDSHPIYDQMQQNCTIVSEEFTKIEQNENGDFDQVCVATRPIESIVVDAGCVKEEKVDIKQEVNEEDQLENVKKQIKAMKHQSEICSTCGIKLKTTISAHYKQSRMCIPRNYKCTSCTASYSSRYKLQIHKQVKHSKMTLMCHICSKIMKSPISLQRHVIEHSMDNNYICEVCGKSFKRKENLAKHTKAHKSCLVIKGRYKGSGEMKYCCKYCLRNFAFYNTFFKHLQTHKEEDPDDEIALKEGDLTCPVCKKEFTQLRPLKNHMLAHKEKRVYLCIHCQDFFNNALLYKKHLANVHDKDKKFTCPQCSKKYQSRQTLNVHLKTHGDPHIQCTFCDRKFHSQTHMTRHQAMIHNVNKGEPFRCKYCSKEFFCKGNLTTHQRIHTGEKPYTCHVCNQSFIASNTRKLHVRKVHGEEEVEKIKMAEW